MIVARRQASGASRAAAALRAWCCAALTASLGACAVPLGGFDEMADDAQERQSGLSSAAASAVPWGAAVHAELARVYVEAGVLEVADNEARRALEIDAHSRDAAHMLALIALRRGDQALAARYFEQALSARGARTDRVLAANYARFICERAAQCAATRPGALDTARVDGQMHQSGEIGQLHAQSIAIDNSAASDPIREQRNKSRTGQSHDATGGTMNRRTRQEYSSEELRDE